MIKPEACSLTKEELVSLEALAAAENSRDKELTITEEEVLKQSPLSLYQIREAMTILNEIEYGVGLVKKEFSQGKIDNIGEMVRKVDYIMKSSVLRAQAQKDVSKDEKGLKQILTAINLNIGDKADRLVRVGDLAFDRSKHGISPGEEAIQRTVLYEKKIKLLQQQVEALKKDNAVKVKFDQRALRYIRESLAQFDSKVLGRMGNYGVFDAQCIGVEDLPNFPSPYPSQQNAVSRNQLFNPLDIELSDAYERLPMFFQQLVPKTHINLRTIIEFYERFEIKQELPKDGYEKAYWWIFKANFSEEEVVHCEVCFQPVGRRWHHVMNVHQDLICSVYPKPLRPKGTLQNTLLRDGICPVGCGYKSTQSEIRMHLIMFHSKVQLQAWCINRDFLKYQEGMLSRRQFIKTIVTRGDPIFDTERGAICQAYAELPEAEQLLSIKSGGDLKEIKSEKEEDIFSFTTPAIANSSTFKSLVESKQEPEERALNSYSSDLVTIQDEEMDDLMEMDQPKSPPAEKSIQSQPSSTSAGGQPRGGLLEWKKQRKSRKSWQFEDEIIIE